MKRKLTPVIRAIMAADSINVLDAFMSRRPKKHRMRRRWNAAAKARRRQLALDVLLSKVRRPKWTKAKAEKLQALTRQIIATHGEDALRSMAYAVERKHWISQQLSGRRLLIAAHNGDQLRLFCRNCGLDSPQVERVLSERDVRGRLTDLPLIVLPGSMRFRDVCEAVTGWLERKGKAIDITEAQVLGEAKFELWSLFPEVKP